MFQCLLDEKELKKINFNCMPEIDKAVKSTVNALIRKHDCGWLDGGCYTLASAICEVYPAAKMYSISRFEHVIDHAVAYFPEMDFYVDGDGFHTKEQLFLKMQVWENCDVKFLRPIPDSEIKKVELNVFSDIKLSLVNTLKQKVA